MNATTPATTPAKKEKPAKPWPDFPLYWHQRGYWMCKRGGREIRYTADATESYKRFLADQGAEKIAGSEIAPRGRYSLRDAINRMYTRCVDRRDAGKMGDVQLAKWRYELKEMLPRAIPKATLLSAFRASKPDDMGPSELFGRIRRMAMKRGVQAAHRHIVMVRSTLDYAAKRRLMLPADYGDDFDAPTKDELDKNIAMLDAKHGDRSWTAGQLRKMIDAAERLARPTTKKNGELRPPRNPHLHAQILMALFGAFGSDDISAMPDTALLREYGVAKFPRVKNREFRPRVCYLPKLVWDAIDVSVKGRAASSGKEFDGLLFRTDGGRKCNAAVPTKDNLGIISAGRNDTIGKNFARLLSRIGLKKKRAGFKTLRAMCRTMMLGADVDGDIISVIMGRKLRDPVDEYYLRGKMREKLIKVARHIEKQLFGAKPVR